MAANFEYINQCILSVELPDNTFTNPRGPTIADVPPDTSYAVPTNQDNCAINNNVFAKHLEDALKK